ncbi:MAG TPA: hypothetical protein VN577_10040 [Terriglobales bacterium]|nr:hypothetical protein [Terriglobales bacterium]
MPTNTPYLNLTKPDRGATNWDAQINGDLDTLDSKAQAVDTALAAKEDKSSKGVANGYAPLGPDGKVPSVNLPVISSPVTSVAGKTGAVTLVEADIANLPADLASKADASSLATVATSGSYLDLTNKPTIPAAQVNSDWNASSGVTQILNKPVLATVATSGSYTDLSNKPTIPDAVTFKTNSVTNGSQTLLNLKAGANITLADDGSGGITVTSSAVAGGTTWGSITGTLSDQTDLQTALNGKAPLYANLTTKTTSYTTATTDGVVLANSASALTITLQATGISSGKIYRVKNTNTGVVTVATTSGTIDGQSTIQLPLQYQSVDLAFDGTNFSIL